MDPITIFFIAVGLAMDAFAVSVASGFAIRPFRFRHAFRIALFFGAFQAIMPLLGWALGSRVKEHIQKIDHWAAFGLLFLIGMRMIYESMKMESNPKRIDLLHLPVLFLLSVATSIDAFAVGITLALLKTTIITPRFIIGSVTFILSLIGVIIGDRFGHFFERKIEIAGGCILMGIGVKILVEHLT
ncbi:MAG: manganese efflux pump MntP family protein [bacterium]